MRTLALAPFLLALLLLPACGSGGDAGSGPTTPAPEPQPAALPDVARAVCTEDGVTLESPSVKPRVDGLHVEVVNETGSELAFSLSGAESGLGFGAPPGTTDEIVDLGPGTLTVTCSDPATGPEEGGATLEVVDEDGVWVTTTLPCAEQFSQVVDYIQGAKGETSDPLAAAREALESFGLEPDDVLERAGYPEAVTARVRLVRAVEPVAVVDLVDDGAGKWLVSMITGCAELQT